MQLIAHTSLFKINSIPGCVYTVYKYMIQFYSVTLRLPFLQILVEKFTEKRAFNRRFYEMGYYSSNFIPLEFTSVCIIFSILFLGLIFYTLARCSVKHYRKKCCRWVGIILPSSYIFRRVFFRIYILMFIQFFLSG